MTRTDSRAKSVIVVGRPRVWPQIWARLALAEAREVRDVQRQRGPEADHAHQGGEEDLPEVRAPAELGRLVEQRAEAARLVAHPHSRTTGADEHEGRRPVLEAADRLHAPVDDGDLEHPEEDEATATGSTGSRRSAPAFGPAVAEELPGQDEDRLRRRSRSGCRTSRRPPPPGSAAGRLAPRTPNEARAKTGKGMPYLGPACPVSSIGTSTMTLASAMVKTACFQSMPSGDQAGSEGPGRGCCGPCRPTAPRSCTWSSVRFGDRDGQQVLVGVGAVGAGRRRRLSSIRPSGGVTWAAGERRWGRCRSWAGQS